MCRIENFNSKLRYIDFSEYLRAIKKKGSESGRKFTYFNYPKHSSNDEIFIEIKNRAETNQLNLELDAGKNEVYKFKIDSVKNKRVDE